MNHELWKRRFGGDPGLVGKTLPLDFSSYQVLGVAAPGFDFPGKMDIFRAVHLGSAQNWDVRGVFAVARLRPGVTIDQPRRRLDDFAARMEQTFPRTNQGVRFQVRTLRDAYSGEVRPYVLLTLGLVAMVLLIACANVVNLLLSRGLARKREFAVRTALGATRGRIARQLLAEAVILAVVGGLAGLGFAWWWTSLIRQWLRVDLPAWMSIDLDGSVLLFTLLASLLAGLAAGLLPALGLSKAALDDAMRDASRGSSGGRTSARVRDALVISELALAVVLLVFAGLLLQSFWKLRDSDTGFARPPALTFRTDPPWARYNKAEQTAMFYRRAIEELSRIPGVTAVAANHSLPLALNQNYGKPAIAAEGESIDEQQRNPFVNVQIVSPGYFETMGIPLRDGRALLASDRLETTPVAVISQPRARRLFGASSPVGRRVQLPGLLSSLNESKPVWLEIAGVAEGVRSDGLTLDPSLDIYLSNQQQFAGDTFFILRTTLGPAALAGAVTRAIQQVDPEQPVFDIQPLAQRIDDTVSQRRMAGSLSLCFGALALLLAAVGSYGVLSFLVSRRTREIGIRLALGSTPGRVWWMVVRQGLSLAGIGIAVGAAVALAAARLLDRVLYGVTAYDPSIYGLALALTVFVALVAFAVPAWRASRTSPVVALQTD